MTMPSVVLDACVHLWTILSSTIFTFFGGGIFLTQRYAEVSAKVRKGFFIGEWLGGELVFYGASFLWLFLGFFSRDIKTIPEKIPPNQKMNGTELTTIHK